MSALAPFEAFGAEVAQHAAGALAAQRAIADTRAGTFGDDVLLAVLLASDGTWRTSQAWLRGFLHEIEKALIR